MTSPSTTILFAIGLLIALGNTTLHAQTPPDTVAAESRVRITAPTAGIPYRSRGVVDSVTAGSLYVRQLTEPPALRDVRQVAVPLAAVTRLDVSMGRRSRSDAIGRGALIGLAAAIVVPVAVALMSGSMDDPDSWGWGGVAIGVAAVAPWAAGIGAAVGALLPVERWRRVIPPPP